MLCSKEDLVEPVEIIMGLPEVGLEGVYGGVRRVGEQCGDRTRQHLPVPEAALQRPFTQLDSWHVVPKLNPAQNYVI